MGNSIIHSAAGLSAPYLQAKGGLCLPLEAEGDRCPVRVGMCSGGCACCGPGQAPGSEGTRCESKDVCQTAPTDGNGVEPGLTGLL